MLTIERIKTDDTYDIRDSRFSNTMNKLQCKLYASPNMPGNNEQTWQDVTNYIINCNFYGAYIIIHIENMSITEDLSLVKKYIDILENNGIVCNRLKIHCTDNLTSTQVRNDYKNKLSSLIDYFTNYIDTVFILNEYRDTSGIADKRYESQFVTDCINIVKNKNKKVGISFNSSFGFGIFYQSLYSCYLLLDIIGVNAYPTITQNYKTLDLYRESYNAYYNLVFSQYFDVVHNDNKKLYYTEFGSADYIYQLTRANQSNESEWPTNEKNYLVPIITCYGCLKNQQETGLFDELSLWWIESIRENDLFPIFIRYFLGEK